MQIVGNDIGSEIRKRRLALNLTQEDLAELSDISVNFLSQLERTNNQNISIKKLDSIATALNSSTLEIIRDAYSKKSDSNNKISNEGYFLNKLIAELKKLPIATSEELSKHFFYIIRDLNKKDINE